MAPSRNRNSEAASLTDVSMVDAPDATDDYTPDPQDTPDYTVRVYHHYCDALNTDVALGLRLEPQHRHPQRSR